jgi:hypothetical protein
MRAQGAKRHVSGMRITAGEKTAGQWQQKQRGQQPASRHVPVSELYLNVAFAGFGDSGYQHGTRRAVPSTNPHHTGQRP